MKKTLFIAAGALFLASCGGTGKDYTVKVTLPDETFDGQTIYIRSSEDESKLDSAVAVKNILSFNKGKIEEPTLAILAVSNELGTLFVLEPGTINVDLNNNVVSGTPLNDSYSKYNAEMIAIYKEVNTLYTQLREKRTEDNQDEIRQEYEAAFENDFNPRINELNLNLLEANKNTILGEVALERLKDSDDIFENERFKTLLADLGPVVKDSKTYQAIVLKMDNVGKTDEGMQFVDFEVTQEDGKVVKFSDYVGKGKYVLVDFWASWCGPCIAEIPNLKSVYDKYKGDNFELLGVAVGDKEQDSRASVKKYDMTWPIIYNAGTLPIDIYGIKGIPCIILFGPDGKILKKNLRGEEIGKEIANYIK